MGFGVWVQGFDDSGIGVCPKNSNAVRACFQASGFGFRVSGFWFLVSDFVVIF